MASGMFAIVRVTPDTGSFLPLSEALAPSELFGASRRPSSQPGPAYPGFVRSSRGSGLRLEEGTIRGRSRLPTTSAT